LAVFYSLKNSKAEKVFVAGMKDFFTFAKPFAQVVKLVDTLL
jgi:hypothetical protein